MRELAPLHEEHWFEIYGRVALTGEPARFVHEARALGDRWFEVPAFPVDQPPLRRVGVLFSNVTERTRADRSLRLLAEITQDLLQLTRENDFTPPSGRSSPCIFACRSALSPSSICKTGSRR